MASNQQPKELNFLSLFERFMNDGKTGRRLQKSGSKLSKGCIQNYEYCFQLLQQFSEKKQFHLRIRPPLPARVNL